MTIIRLRCLSLGEAEEAIATLWTCLEEYGIPTPHMDFRFESAGRATLSLRIGSEWHHIVKRRIASSMIGACLNALRVETDDEGHARFHTNARGIARGSRGRERGHLSRRAGDSEADAFEEGLASRGGLAPFVAGDTSTIRSIH